MKQARKLVSRRNKRHGLFLLPQFRKSKFHSLQSIIASLRACNWSAEAFCLGATERRVME